MADTFPRMNQDIDKIIGILDEIAEEREQCFRLLVGLMESVQTLTASAGHPRFDIAPTPDAVGQAISALHSIRPVGAGPDAVIEAMETAGFSAADFTAAEVIERQAAEIRALVGALERRSMPAASA